MREPVAKYSDGCVLTDRPDESKRLRNRAPSPLRRLRQLRGFSSRQGQNRDSQNRLEEVERDAVPGLRSRCDVRMDYRSRRQSGSLPNVRSVHDHRPSRHDDARPAESGREELVRDALRFYLQSREERDDDTISTESYE